MTNSVVGHPDAATLMAFAAGTLAEPLAAVVAAHVAVCAGCARARREMELFGLELVTREAREDDTPLAVPPMPVGAGTPDPAAPVPVPAVDCAGSGLPAPLSRAYGLTIETVPWRRLAPGVWQHKLALSSGATGELRLLKVAPGRSIPHHGHGGAELTLVIEGSYSDASGRYQRGDCQDTGEEIEHKPVADAEAGCICLVASEHPAEFKGLLGLILKPWAR